MSVNSEQLDVVGGIKTARPGDPALRLIFEGDEDGNKFLAKSTFGYISTTEPIYDDDMGAFVIPVQSAADCLIEYSYAETARQTDLIDVSFKGLNYAYSSPMILFGLGSGVNAINNQVSNLVENDLFEKNERIWKASVIGNRDVRLISRALFISMGLPEKDRFKFGWNGQMTHPQIRADVMDYMAGFAMKSFMDMPFNDPNSIPDETA